jgi:hypothetical protein
MVAKAEGRSTESVKKLFISPKYSILTRLRVFHFKIECLGKINNFLTDSVLRLFMPFRAGSFSGHSSRIQVLAHMPY